MLHKKTLYTRNKQKIIYKKIKLQIIMVSLQRPTDCLNSIK